MDGFPSSSLVQYVFKYILKSGTLGLPQLDIIVRLIIIFNIIKVGHAENTSYNIKLLLFLRTN